MRPLKAKTKFLVDIWTFPCKSFVIQTKILLNLFKIYNPPIPCILKLSATPFEYVLFQKEIVLVQIDIRQHRKTADRLVKNEAKNSM